MPTVTKLARVATVLSIISVPFFALNTAYASGRGEDGSRGHTEEHGNATGDGALSSTVGVIVYDRSKNGSGASVGPVTSTTSWAPPACWYAPKYTPA
ncbi:hypothetical protein ABZX30_38170, partial [Streptomyces sp. NPDC004542]